ncbi:MAG: sugar phosphate isomerase/epimerase [Planctomycetota bacterium]|nr:sugar phosphate isomerase/epimerase [Planctomycetota bacterium]
MFKNLDFTALNISGRQSELIELTLSFGFKGFDLNIVEFSRQVQTKGIDHSRRLLDSAKIQPGTFPLPIDWEADEAQFQSELQQLSPLAELAQQLGCSRCTATVAAGGDLRPYAENFEVCRRRFGQIGDVLANFDVRLGLGFLAPALHRRNCAYEFVHSFDQLLLLAKSVGRDNVGVCLDVWHWHVGGGQLSHIEALTGSDIVAVDIADARTPAGYEDADPADRRLPAAASEDEGYTIDFPAILTVVAKAGFDGPLTAKPHPSQFDGLQRDQIVRRCGESLDALWQAAGLNRQGKLAVTGC